MLGIGSEVEHKEFGTGVVVDVKSASYLITFIGKGLKEIAHSYPLDVIDEEEEALDRVSMYDIERSLTNILMKWADVQQLVPLGQKWIGGKVIIQPSDTNLKGLEFSIDSFFHKIVMLRDRLRVMEQKVNASNINDEEKVAIQQYITRCYGTLTTFNVLFKNPDDKFIGEKGS